MFYKHWFCKCPSPVIQDKSIISTICDYVALYLSDNHTYEVHNLRAVHEAQKGNSVNPQNNTERMLPEDV